VKNCPNNLTEIIILTKSLFTLWIRFLAFLVRHRIARDWAESRIAPTAWGHGFMAAVIDLERKTATHLSCTERCLTALKPKLPVIRPSLCLAWDAGYQRAITLYRLGLNPREQFLRAPDWARYGGWSESFDSWVHITYMGELGIDPRGYREISGRSLHAHNEMQFAVHARYLQYANGIRTVTDRMANRCAHEALRSLNTTIRGTDNAQSL
jgi:hypothetical protein